MIERQLSFIVSSDVANGARNVRDLGSAFDVQLDDAIAIPPGAVNCTLEVNQTSIWNTVPNISVEQKNDTFYFSAVEPAVWETITIDKGLYSVSALNAAISRGLVNLGYDADKITMTGDEATQKIVFTFKDVNTSIDFTQADTFREIVGFDSRIVGPSTIAGETELGDNVAAFNQVNSFLLHSTIINQGIPVNAIGASIIARVPIDVSPGSQINYSPNNPVPTAANTLIGSSLNRFSVWLTDQANRPVDTNGEVFDALIIIRYHV